MNTWFLITAAVVASGLAVILLWALRGASENGTGQGLSVLEWAASHVRNMPQIRQAANPADFEFVLSKGGRELQARLRRERKQVLMLYLQAIRRDFEGLLRVARVIAVLSPQVSGSHEYERLRLQMVFRVRFQMVKLGLLLGVEPQTQLASLGEMAANLAFQMQQTMAQLGEKAALAAELALQSGR